MKVSWNWLNDFIDLSDLTPQEVGDRLTMAGVELDGLEARGGELDNVVVGHIVEREAHPDADKLSLCKVDVGEAEPLQIVCGAPNAREGLYAPLAMIGASLPNGMKIKKGKIRGVKSFGMLCSAEELELSGGHDGLLELDATNPGTPLADALGIRDYTLELGLTPNRPDCLSIYGVARELGALLGRPLKSRETNTIDSATGEPHVGDVVSVAIEAVDGCPRYACGVIKGMKVADSPAWMQRRLEAVGVRPVNNLVDVTNYVMFELGQPLHAFDLRDVKGQQITVRHAHAGEKMESIDHVERELLDSDVVIADAERPVALAGVMGGVDSEIKDDTTDVLIECANFDPSFVRRTARRLGMHTDSSHRFERGVDVTRVPEVLERTIELMMATQEAIGVQARRLPGTVDAVARTWQPTVIEMPVGMPTRILGMDFDREAVVGSLESLGLLVQGEDPLTVTVPPWRPDLERPIDLVEEVGRIRGYEALPSILPPGRPGERHVERSEAGSREQKWEPIQSDSYLDALGRVRDVCVDAGLFESVNWSFSDRASLERFDALDEALALRNPLGDETALMRTLLMPGLLRNVAHNIARGSADVGLFELGRAFRTTFDPEAGEPVRLAVAWTGRTDTSWESDGTKVDGHDVARLLEKVAHAVRRPVVIRAAEPPRWAHPGVYADVFCGEERVGWLGHVHPNVLDAYDVGSAVAALELDLDALLGQEASPPRFSGLVRTPPALRDAAFLIAVSTTYDQVGAAIDAFAHPFLESVELFDVYEGENVEEGHRSLAFRLTYRKDSGSLTDKQVDKAHRAFVSHMEDRLGARLR